MAALDTSFFPLLSFMGDKVAQRAHAVLSLVVLVFVVLLLARILQSQRQKLFRKMRIFAVNDIGHTEDDSRKLPHYESLVPVIGHVWSLQRTSAAYLHRLLVKTGSPLFTINFMTRNVLVAHPSLDKSLARHASDMGLAQIVSIVGKRLFNMEESTIKFIVGYDPRPQHRHEFYSALNVRRLADDSFAYMLGRLKSQPSVQQVPFAKWLFSLGVQSTACAVWGAENPWDEDKEFMQSFTTLTTCLDTLGRPLPQYTARPAFKARRVLLEKLAMYHTKHWVCRMTTAAHRINAVYLSDENWESNKDYFRVELLSALGLLVTPATLMVWLVWHLLADPPVFQAVVAEVRTAKTLGENSKEVDESLADGVDLRDIRNTCPKFAAAFYETLRLHMTGLPRIARHDFDFDVPWSSKPMTMKKGEILLMPMYTTNIDPETWGPEATEFDIGRFIDGNGKLNNTQVRKVKGFGVAGNLCPGRVFGFDVVMTNVASVLRKYDIRRADGAAFRPPTVLPALSIGFQRFAGDMTVVLEEPGHGKS
ncbi:hypothetical protein S7711_07873 [Stachybotrys chartarum IBT 7711]|uniref:Uncharacterized protein n=1 Tax=Stachybotrys chartarum (strain CBS 109288 / IBT 7711) TaxID=1280523 RepID=A0A084AJZ5_STACB|nr:hypothetical protein S7711_07873 [Stachybotrys chartarum IBT 7711]